MAWQPGQVVAVEMEIVAQATEERVEALV